ncbi:uncharacterized protein [Anabrus simplex]|uniref:uncharacterized protein n=1 Tax=Anabrus simplex TaxID=316456 RepID=UPI0034DD3921
MTRSTRKSIGLVNELLCDLKKQLYLERMTTNEKSSRYKETIARYESIWENYQAIYMTFPKAKEVRDLRVAVKLDGIKLASRRVEMGDLRKKIKTLQEVTDKQNTCMTVEVAELMLKRMACAAKREMLQKNLRELKAEVTLLKKEKTQMLESLVVRGKAAAAATAVAPAGLSGMHGE